MQQANDQLKGELWQVLTHAFANSLIIVGLLLAFGGALSFVTFPRARISLTVLAIGIGLVFAAAILHLIAWAQPA